MIDILWAGAHTMWKIPNLWIKCSFCLQYLGSWNRRPQLLPKSNILAIFCWMSAAKFCTHFHKMLHHVSKSSHKDAAYPISGSQLLYKSKEIILCQNWAYFHSVWITIYFLYHDYCFAPKMSTIQPILESEPFTESNSGSYTSNFYKFNGFCLVTFSPLSF